MVASEADVLALVDNVRQAAQAAEAAWHARRRADDEAKEAGATANEANRSLQQAQTALVVAACGTDRSFMWSQ